MKEIRERAIVADNRIVGYCTAENEVETIVEKQLHYNTALKVVPLYCVVTFAGKCPQVYNFCTSVTAEEKKKDAEQYYKPEEIQVMLYDDFLEIQRAVLLDGEPEEITESEFEEMLDVLPPLYWGTINGIEMFCMREMYTGTYTFQYAYNKMNDKYYRKMVDAADRSTWLHNML